MKVRLYQMWKNEVLRMGFISLLVVSLMDVLCVAEGQFYLDIVGGIYEVIMSLYLVWYALNKLPDVYTHYKNNRLYEKIFSDKNVRFEDNMERAVIYRSLYHPGKRPYPTKCEGVDTPDYYIRSHKVFHENVPKPRAGGGAQVVSRFQRVL